MEYKYDAFISYRHCELDKFVAENLHKQLEAFKLPKNIAKKEDLKRKKIERVFRDRDELPLASNLEDPIVEALTSSEFLIVICSPRLKESMWCTKEIQTFIEMHGRHKVLAVLIEGEPEDSFPKELLVDDDGNPIEPLAADVRGKNNAEVKKAIKAEMLRLLAPMFGLGYDDLKQRHREQQLKRTAGIVSLCGIVGIAFGVVCATSAIRINAQKKQIEQQNEVLAKAQAETLSEDALELYNNDNRHDSIELAYKAMTEYEGVKMPRSAYSEQVLAECMSVYDGANLAKSGYQIKTPGIIKAMRVSPSGQFILTIDDFGNIITWDATTKESVYEIKEEEYVYVFDFIDDDSFYYLTTKGGLNIATISSKSIRNEANGDDLFFDVSWDAKLLSDSKRIAVRKNRGFEIYDIDTLKPVCSYEASDENSADDIFVNDKAGIVYVAESNENEENFCALVDLYSGNVIAKNPIAGGIVQDAAIGEDAIYILSSEASFKAATNWSCITALDLVSGEKKYEVSTVGIVAMDIHYSNAEGRENLLLESYGEFRLIDAKTGDVRQTYFKGNNTASVMNAADGDYLVYDENGVCRCIDVGDELSDLEIPTIRLSKVEQLETCAVGMVGRRKNDDRLVFYTYLLNKDSYEYDKEVKGALSESMDEEESQSFAKEKGIENATFVKECLSVEDINAYLVYYADNTLRVYSADTNELIKKYDDLNDGQFKYYGKVKDYYLVGGFSKGYLFDESGEIRAKIESFAGLSDDGESVVVYGRNFDAEKCQMALPIYTQEGLLKKTKEYLDKYTN